MTAEQTMPEVLYTEDNLDWAPDIIKVFNLLGLQVQHFRTNDAASSFVTNMGKNSLDAAVIDYHTFGGELSGVEFISQLAQNKVCGEILVLSSTAGRGILFGKLKRYGIENKVEIFTKQDEFVAAAVYVATRIFHPEITITRNGILRALGLTVSGNGDVLEEGAEIFQRNYQLLKIIRAGDFDLHTFALEAQEYSIEELIETDIT